MTIELPDFTNLGLLALGTLVAITAALDTGWNILLAIAHGNFSGQYVADFLRTHVSLRVFPIIGTAILGNGIPAVAVPAIPALSLLATAGLGAYIVETAVSMAIAMKDTRPVPTPPTPTPEG